MKGGKDRLEDSGEQADCMVFGFDRATDERSLADFLQHIASPNMLAKLIPRLASHEIDDVVEIFTGLMKKHLSKSEYHDLFLGDGK